MCYKNSFCCHYDAMTSEDSYDLIEIYRTTENYLKKPDFLVKNAILTC